MIDHVIPLPLTLSREDLYEFAWSKPMRELAKDFGISDVALAKRCRRLGIPVPGRGYWARLDAGQTPHRPKLPEREPQWPDQRALTVAASMEIDPSVEERLEQHPPDALDAVRARIAALDLKPIACLAEALPAVKRSGLKLKHPSRAEWTWSRGEKSGPLVDLEVSTSGLDRALVLADSLLRAASALGWKFVAPPPPEQKASPTPARAPTLERQKPEPVFGRLTVEGETIGVRIEERMRKEPRVPTARELAREKREYCYYAQRKTLVPTGNLRVVRLDLYRAYGDPDRHTWHDRKGSRVEDQLKEILLGFYELSLSIKARRAEAERQEREQQEAERRQQELEARQEANTQLIKQLETDAGAWHRARYLRRYVGAARRRLGEQSLLATFREEVVNFLNWAEGYVNQLDPLNAQPRSADFERRTSYRYESDVERLANAMTRLLGSHWPHAWKVDKHYPGRPTTPDPWRDAYRERSVFEVPEAEPAAPTETEANDVNFE